MTNNKSPTKPTLQTSRSSPGDSAFGNSLFISQSPFQEHLDSSTPIIDVQSPSLYLSKDAEAGESEITSPETAFSRAFSTASSIESA